MKIWIDADACPGAIREIVVKAAVKRQVALVYVANTALGIPQSPLISSVQVPKTPDAADTYIATHAEPGDLVITQDIPLAALLVEKKVVAISPHGTVFTDHNIGERLSVRNFLTDLRDNGIQTGGPKPFSDRDKQQFANAFDKAFTQLHSKSG